MSKSETGWAMPTPISLMYLLNAVNVKFEDVRTKENFTKFFFNIIKCIRGDTLRPRQLLSIDKIDEALRNEKNNNRTLFIAPTGSGKTVMFSAYAGAFRSNFERANPERKAKVCIISHRIVINGQNESTLSTMYPGVKTSIIGSDSKSWIGDVFFAMVPTLSQNLKTIPLIDLLIIDECHHVPAETYRKILNSVLRIIKDVKVLGETGNCKIRILIQLFLNHNSVIILTLDFSHPKSSRLRRAWA